MATEGIGKRETIVHRPAEDRAWALPPLEASLGITVRSVYGLVAACVLVLACCWLVFEARDNLGNAPADLRFGFRTSMFHDGIHVAAASPSAQRAGLHRRDTILATDGNPLAREATEFDVGQRAAAAKNALRLSVRSDSGFVHDVTLRAGPSGLTTIDTTSGLPLWLHVACRLADAELFLIMVSLILMWRRPRDPEAVLLAFALMLTGLPTMWWLYSKAATLGSDVLYEWGLDLLFVAMAGFPDGRYRTRLAKAVVCGALIASVSNTALILIGGGADTASPLSTSAEAISMTLALSTTVAVMQTYFGTPAGEARQQIKWVVVGFCVSAFGLVATDLLAQAGVFSARGIWPLFLLKYALGWMISGGFALGLLVSLLRYRLYDVDAAISRSIAVGALTLGLLAVFAGSEKLVEKLGEEFLGERMGIFSAGLGAAIAAILIVPLHHRVNHWAEHRFRKNLIHLRDALPRLLGGRRAADEAGIVRTVLDAVMHDLSATRAALCTDDRMPGMRALGEAAFKPLIPEWGRNREVLECELRDRQFPIRLRLVNADGTAVGWLLIGPRPDGSLYGRDEREALREISLPIADAIELASERKRQEEQLELRFSRLENRMLLLTKKLNIDLN